MNENESKSFVRDIVAALVTRGEPLEDVWRKAREIADMEIWSRYAESTWEPGVPTHALNKSTGEVSILSAKGREIYLHNLAMKAIKFSHWETMGEQIFDIEKYTPLILRE